tara:strand:+ start:1106 stop:1597 length:492 start_codon:yes stop_codon:yes gene_type:complete
MSNQIFEALFIQQRLQILHLGVHHKKFTDSYLYAWYNGVYPINEDSDGSVLKRPHEVYEEFFRVSKSKVDTLCEYLYKMFDNGKVHTFYELEDEFGVSSSTNGMHLNHEWSRGDLLEICRYLHLEDSFDETFWSSLLTPGQHPTEARSIIRSFNREADIYFMW